MGLGGQHQASAALPRESPGTHYTGGWVGPRAGLDGAVNLAPTGILSSDRPARSAVPTELSRPRRYEYEHTY